MSTSEVFQQFYYKLMTTLPMSNPIFIGELVSHDLLSGDFVEQLKSLARPSDQATHFLDHVIKPAINIGVERTFNELLDVMRDSKDITVKELAKQIRNKMKEEQVITSGKLYNL